VTLALRQLSKRQRECILLGLFAGFSSDEVAEFLRLSPATVRVHISRGRALLKKELAI
jgi:RNA polymerase sigma factor (sigma-70 family)